MDSVWYVFVVLHFVGISCWLAFFIFTVHWVHCVLFLLHDDVLVSGLFYICMMLAFLVRMSMFVVHLHLLGLV
jgi:hypothetical protein